MATHFLWEWLHRHARQEHPGVAQPPDIQSRADLRFCDAPKVGYEEFLADPEQVVQRTLTTVGYSEMDAAAKQRLANVLDVRHQPSRTSAKSNYQLSNAQTALVRQLVAGQSIDRVTD